MRALLTVPLLLIALDASAVEPAIAPSAPAPSDASRGPLLQWNVGKAMGPSPDAVLLAPVEVTGQRDALAESDQRLKKRIASLPCTGCGGDTAQEKVGVVEKVLTGAVGVLKAQFVAPENAGEQDSIEDRAGAEALARPLIRPGQDP